MSTPAGRGQPGVLGQSGPSLSPPLRRYDVDRPRVFLRKFRPDESEILFAQLREWLPDAVSNDEGYWRDEPSKRIVDSGDWGDAGLDLAIEVDGELVGAVQALGAYYHLSRRMYELGIELYSSAIGARVSRPKRRKLFVPPLFEREGAIRLQGHTHVVYGLTRDDYPGCRSIDQHHRTA